MPKMEENEKQMKIEAATSVAAKQTEDIPLYIERILAHNNKLFTVLFVYPLTIRYTYIPLAHTRTGTHTDIPTNK